MINKDGTVNKLYVRKLWNHVTDTACDSFNGELTDKELEGRIDEFVLMLNDLLKHDREIRDSRSLIPNYIDVVHEL